ncbi:MAG: uracil phosphoribosyltransferase [Mucilaginibacter polytrichastri]|nr:uracil phosphoribosyltransferase [Mucilaginibacter polytrichastri]
MPFILNHTDSIANQFLAELRDAQIQQDAMRFRLNLRRLGSILAYEISKKMRFTASEVETPLGTAELNLMNEQPVLGTILRAGIPFQEGFLDFFDRSPCAFITAYRKVRKSGDFIIQMEHISTPDLDGRILILCDPMLATGQSVVMCCKELLERFKITELHIASVIASSEGIEHVKAHLPKAKIWTAAVDEEMTTRSYIVPGLGDAGDLAFGEKV